MIQAGSVLVAGSANLDFVVRAPHIPIPGETVLGVAYETWPGGKGANQAVACARAGDVSTRMLLALGNDAFAVPIEASLRSAGIDPEIVRVPYQPTGVAFVCLSDHAENAITVAPGANTMLRPEHLPSLEDVTHLLLQLETPLPTVAAWASIARSAGITVVLNAAPALTLPRSLLTSIDILIVNEGELATVSAIPGDIVAAMNTLDVPCVIVTLGSRGSCARIGGQWLFQPAFCVETVDSTGAGDTFCGTLVASLNRGMSFAQALRRASGAAALSCIKPGAQSSVPGREEVERMLAADHRAGAADELAAYCGLS